MISPKKIQTINHLKKRTTNASATITPAEIKRVFQQGKTCIEMSFQHNQAVI